MLHWSPNIQPDDEQYMQSLFSHICLTLKMKTTGKLESQEKVKYIGLVGLNWIALSFYSVSHHLHSDIQ